MPHTLETLSGEASVQLQPLIGKLALSDPDWPPSSSQHQLGSFVGFRHPPAQTGARLWRSASSKASLKVTKLSQPP